MGLWTLLGIIAWLTKYFPGKYNNFSIFRQSFWHTLNELPLYAAYPQEYNDIFHYGPVFSLVVAPFAITPLWLGLLTWSVAQSLFLFWAIKMLPGIKRERIFIYWFCAHELLTSLFMSQFNISITAIIVLSYALIEKEKDLWAAFVIMLGTFTKLYGITGLAFFFFSRHKVKFCLFVCRMGASHDRGPDDLVGTRLHSLAIYRLVRGSKRVRTPITYSP